MVATPVSLQEVLSAIGGPLEEQSLWALLYQTCKSLEKALQGGERPELLITPDSTLLFRGGSVKFLQGISAPESTYTAPELIIGHGDYQGKEDREKSYIYSLGTTLFTAMHFELENGKEPMVGSQLNGILLKMVDDSLDTRASFDDLREACSQQQLDDNSIKEEVNRLVTYVMGTAPELSSSEYGDTDMDDANLESEFQQAMMIQPTGSVEQLYSPSYGSRASSSLSLNSSGNRSDLVNFHSSLPMVYCSSQERLGAKGNGRRIHRPKWSSHDRLLSPLLSADIEALASKGKRQSPLESAAAHRHYHSHLYTPKRTRKTEIGGAGPPLAVAANVERSASFNSTGIYRSSSDGVSKKASASVVAQQPLPVAMDNLNLDDMPALPPQTTKDAITTSPDVSQDLSTSLPLDEDASVSPSLPPLPYTGPPLFTTPAQEEAGSSSDTVTTDATFDYNDLTPPVENGKSIGSHGDDEFDFSLSESPPPPPPVSSLPPLDEQTPPTSPEAPPTLLTSPPHEEIPDDNAPITDKEDVMLNERPETADKAENESQLQRRITPKTALIKAFEDLDKIGETKLPEDDELGTREGERGEGEGEKTIEKGSEEGKIEGGGLEGSGTVDLDELYAKVDMTKKTRKQKTSEKRDEDVREGESESGMTFKPEIVHKAASVEDIVGPDYAEVHHPKRSSLPSASSPAHSPTHSEPGYARIETIVSPPPGEKAVASTEPHPPQGEPHPPADQGRLYEVTATDTISRRNQRSIRKLGVMFGPEFKNISGLQTQNKPQSVKSRSESSSSSGSRASPVKVVPEGRRIVKVILLNGRQVPFVVERHSLCAELFQQVLSHQSLQEKRFFGLAISKEWDEIFLEMDSKLSKYAPPGWVNTPVPAPGSKGQRPKAFNVFFRVKFYVENINDLKFAQTRHLYYLQLRKDLLEGKTYCHEQPALKMASFALQAEKGDIPSKRQPYFRMEDYVPLKVMDKVGKRTIEELLPNMHAELKSMSREKAELEFLKEAQKLPEYGMVFYRVAQNKSDPIGSVWLGFCVRGIVVYDYHKDVKTPLHYCSWKKTQNLSFSNRKFIIELQDSKPLHFYTNSYKKARYLLHLSISYHTFQLTSRGHLPQEAEYSVAESAILAEQETSFQRSQESKTQAGSGDVSHDQKSHDQRPLELTVRLLKDNLQGLGINIVDLTDADASGGAVSSSRIVIESIVKGGPADSNGKLQRGDIVVSVNGQSLAGCTRQEASAIIKNSPDVVNLQILRDERTVVPFRDPSLSELTAAVVEGPTEVASSRPPPQTSLQRGEDEFSRLPQGETFLVHVKKESGTFGLRIAGGKGKPFGGGFIYVKNLVKDSPAERCGRLQERDIIMKINGHVLLDITHREVATLIVTAKSDDVELLVHRPSAANWLESSHDVYMAERKGRGMAKKREVSWSDLEPWMEQQVMASLPTIKESGGGDTALDEEIIEDEPVKDGDDERPPEIPQEFPPDDSLANIEEDLPSLPEDGPPPVMEDESQQLVQDDEDLPPDSNLSEDEKSNERTQDESTHSRGMHKEESFQGEPPLPPESEPPLLTFDESSEELSWEQAERDHSSHEPLNSNDSTRQSTPIHTVSMTDEEPEISEPSQPKEAIEGSTNTSTSSSEAEPSPGLPTTNGLAVNDDTTANTKPSSEHDDKSSEAESLQLDTSLEQENVLTITLKKGFRGLGFMLDKKRSLAEGGVFVGSIEADPAKSDGRLQPGDQILEVDDESLEGLSYSDARLLLRQTEGLVELVVLRQEKKEVAAPDNNVGNSSTETEQLPPLPSTPLPNEDD